MAEGRVLKLDGTLFRKAGSITIEEYLTKPDRTVSRDELAGFVECVVVNHVALLIRESLQLNNRETMRRVEELVERSIDAALEGYARALAQRSWRARLARAWRRFWLRPPREVEVAAEGPTLLVDSADAAGE